MHAVGAPVVPVVVQVVVVAPEAAVGVVEEDFKVIGNIGNLSSNNQHSFSLTNHRSLKYSKA